MSANHTFTVTYKLNGKSLDAVLDEAVDHLYGQDGESLSLAWIDKDRNVVAYDLTCAMRSHEAEDWAAELAESMGLELVAFANPNAHA